jgi:hypothetical protein
LPSILLGTRISGRPAAAQREAAAQASLTALVRAGAAACVTLAFADESLPDGSFETLHVLERDAPSAAGVDGPRKPIVDEMIDALTVEAARRGIPRIGIVNGDIVVLPGAVERDLASGVPAAAFARTDTGDGQPEASLLYGLDMFTFDVAFWKRERHRFRAYIFGDAIWDNVYGALVASHGGVLFTGERLILHERHPAAWHGSPFAAYLQRLAARDSSYFSAWCAFVEGAKALRATGGTMEDERALQRQVFHPPGVAVEALDVMRGSWWRLKRALGA